MLVWGVRSPVPLPVGALLLLLLVLLMGAADPAHAGATAAPEPVPDDAPVEQPEPDEQADEGPDQQPDPELPDVPENEPTGGPPAGATTTAPADPPAPDDGASDDGSADPAPDTGEPTGGPTPTGAEPTAAPSVEPSVEPSLAPSETPTSPGTESTTSTTPATEPQPVRLSPSAPALSSSGIPVGSVALALVVLLVGGLLVRAALRREGRAGAVLPSAVVATGVTGASAATGVTGATGATGAAEPSGGPADPATLDFLLALGEALVDSGDAINHVQETLEQVAAVNGVHGVGIVVMPTALFVSLPHQDGVQTEVTSAGEVPLRLDQVDEVFRIVDQARSGALGPSDGRVALARARASAPPFSAGLQLLGYLLFTLGLVLILRGGWLELLVGGGVGLLVGALQLASDRLRSSYQPFLPVVAALGASAVVLSVARALPELAVFPPLVAALVAFLPGALLTTAVLELSTGQIMSGSARLAAGAMRLVLLALGILAGAQLVGVPAAAIDHPSGGAATVAATWLGVAVFGVGVVLFKGARWSSLRWVLLVLYVAYAGQVLGGLLFGSSLSAFFGALAMTPVAMLVARQPSGPPALVSFLPGFWLLVPGAAGLEGVTRFLDEDTAAGVSSLVTMGTSMVAIALGVLLGLAVGGQVSDRLRLGAAPAAAVSRAG